MDLAPTYSALGRLGRSRKTVRPTCVGPLGGAIEGVDNRWEPDSKVRDAELAHLDALVEVP
jgi:hypothetical protein